MGTANHVLPAMSCTVDSCTYCLFTVALCPSLVAARYTAADGRVGGSSFAGCLQLALAVVPLNPGCNTARALLDISSSGSSSGGGGGSGEGSEVNLSSPHQHQTSDDGSRLTGLYESSRAAEGDSAGEGWVRSGGREMLGAKVRGSRTVEEGLGGQDSASGGGVDNAGPSVGKSGRRQRGIGGAAGGADRAEAGGRGGQGSRCSMDGVDVPPLSGSFLAVENLYWTAKALGLGQTASLQVRCHAAVEVVIGVGLLVGWSERSGWLKGRQFFRRWH